VPKARPPRIDDLQPDQAPTAVSAPASNRARLVDDTAVDAPDFGAVRHAQIAARGIARVDAFSQRAEVGEVVCS